MRLATKIYPIEVNGVEVDWTCLSSRLQREIEQVVQIARDKPVALGCGVTADYDAGSDVMLLRGVDEDTHLPQNIYLARDEGETLMKLMNKIGWMKPSNSP